MHATADIVLTGAAAGDSFGSSVAGAGDVNGDGYGDVIVGAIGNDACGSNVNGTFFFRVTARTSNVNEYRRSNIVSGHSVDNLAPLAIGGLSAVPVTTTSVRLSWPPNTHDPDLGAYVVYRSVTNGFVPGVSDQIQAQTDTSYLDNSLPAAPIIYYRVRARDIHGNLGGLSPQAAVALASTQNYGVGNSWNMISVPMKVDDFTKTVMYPTAISDAFAYSGGYVTRSTLENGTGYWLKFPSAQSVSMTGFAQAGELLLTLNGPVEGEIPTVFALEQNFPNPFNPTTVVRYQVPASSQVRLVVYDVLGREVRVLVDERKAAGYHAMVFDACEDSPRCTADSRHRPAGDGCSERGYVARFRFFRLD